MCVQECKAKQRSSCYSEIGHFILALETLHLYWPSLPSNTSSEKHPSKARQIHKVCAILLQPLVSTAWIEWRGLLFHLIPILFQVLFFPILALLSTVSWEELMLLQKCLTPRSAWVAMVITSSGIVVLNKALLFSFFFHPPPQWFIVFCVLLQLLSCSALNGTLLDPYLAYRWFKSQGFKVAVCSHD